MKKHLLSLIAIVASALSLGVNFSRPAIAAPAAVDVAAHVVSHAVASATAASRAEALQASDRAWALATFVRKGPRVVADATADNITGSTSSSKIPLVVQQRTGASVSAFSVYAGGQTRFQVDTNGSTVLNGCFALRRTATAAASVTIAVAQCGFHAITPSAAFTANLPAINTLPSGGSIIVLKNVAGTGATRNLTIDPSGAETVDGAATVTLTAAYWYAVLFGDSTGWYIVASST